MSRRMCEHRLAPGPPTSAAGTQSRAPAGRDQKPCSAWSQTGSVAQPLLQRLPARPLTMCTSVSLPLRQGAQQGQQPGVGPGQLGRGGERHQRPVVVEQQQQLFGAAERCDQLGPARGPAGGAETVRTAGRETPPAAPGTWRPTGARRRSAPGSGAAPAARGARRAPSRGAVEPLGRAVDVVGIHQHRLGQLPRGAGELAQHQHAVAVGRARRRTPWPPGSSRRGAASPA